MSKIKKIFLYTVLFFMAMVIFLYFQVSRYFNETQIYFDKEVTTWVGTDLHRKAKYENFQLVCLNADMFKKQFKEATEGNQPLTKFKCAEMLGHTDLSVFISSIDYSHIDPPFPYSIGIDKSTK